ncbi:MAG TPA: hypothetical protein VHG69_09270, partial [Thermoleophilaceae bacterium]|nr:hypothetical protein [Thermoleophilaceae bacterium]
MPHQAASNAIPSEVCPSAGIALFAAWCGVLVCGDYLSDVEIPGLGDGGSLDAYRATLARLGALVERAETV